MPRLKRDNYYVDLIEHVLRGVQVTPAPEPRTRGSRLDITRRSWTRGETSSDEEVVVAIGDRSRDRE